MHYEGDAFAKSCAIDYGLAFLRRDDWLVHLDADIWLPPMTRQWIEWRSRIRSASTASTAATAWLEACAQVHRSPNGATAPARAWMPHVTSAIPHGSKIHFANTADMSRSASSRCGRARFPERRYPLNQGSAEHSDVLHAIQWPASNRRILPEIIAVHLDSESSQMRRQLEGEGDAQIWARKKHIRPVAPVARHELCKWLTEARIEAIALSQGIAIDVVDRVVHMLTIEAVDLPQSFAPEGGTRRSHSYAAKGWRLSARSWVVAGSEDARRSARSRVHEYRSRGGRDRQESSTRGSDNFLRARGQIRVRQPAPESPLERPARLERGLRFATELLIVRNMRTELRVVTFVAFPYLRSSHAATNSDHDPRGSFGNQNP